MPGVKAIRHLLVGDAALTAVVAPDRIASDLPQDVALPAIAVSQITGTYASTIAGDGDDVCRARVQVTVHATSRPSQKAIQKLVRAALPRMRRIVSDVPVESLVKDIIGPDLRDDVLGSFVGSQDFIITYVE